MSLIKRRLIWKIFFFIMLFSTDLVVEQAFKKSSYVWAQINVSKVIILESSLDNFPEYRFRVRFLDDYGKPVSQISVSDLELRENGRPLDIAGIQPVAGPIQIFFVFDAGAGILSQLSAGQSRADWMRMLALKVVNQMAPEDVGGFLVVSPQGVSVIQGLTRDKDRLAQSIQAWRPSDPGQRLSAGLDGVQRAISELSKASNLPRIVLLFSGGIQTGGSGISVPDREEEVLQEALRQDVVVYVVHLRRATNPFDERHGYVRLTSEGRGRLYTPENFEEFFTDLSQWRSQFDIFARSQTAEQNRELELRLRHQPEIGQRWRVVLPNSLRPPKVALVVNQGRDYVLVQQQGEMLRPDVLPIELHIQWEDPYPRRIRQVELFANGQSIGPALQFPDISQPIVQQWKIQPKYDVVTFKAVVIDELGLQSQIEHTISIDLQTLSPIAQLDIMCRTLAKIPSIGQEAANLICVQLGLGLGEVIAITLGMVTVMLLYRKREVVREKVTEITQSFVDRVTKTFGFQKAKARLVLEAGGDEEGHLPKVIELSGDTTIGRDPQYADIVIDRPAVSRLHCTLHEDPVTGRWYIEDKESTNGTFLNDRRLEPHQPTPIKTGDLLDIAPLYRGGVRFRFEQLEEPIEGTGVIDETLDTSVEATQTLDYVDMDDEERRPMHHEAAMVGTEVFDDLFGDEDIAYSNTKGVNDDASSEEKPYKGVDEDFDPTRAEF